MHSGIVSVLIETLWNVNPPRPPLISLQRSFNRNIVECKSQVVTAAAATAITF